MEVGRSILSSATGWVLLPFQGHDALFSLTLLSIVMSVWALWIFGRVSNQEAIKTAKAKLLAHLYEMRLFSDEPALIWKAQLGLIGANVRYLRLMLVPVLIISAPLIPILSELDCFYTYAPLRPGREAVVTIQMKRGGEGDVPELRAPEGIAVESRGVRADGGRQISWRIRALRAVRGEMEFVFPGEVVGKSVQAGVGPQYLSRRRVSSALDLLWHPAERRLAKGRVEWIEIRYPEANVHWLLWLFSLSVLSALLLKGRFGVVL